MGLPSGASNRAVPIGVALFGPVWRPGAAGASRAIGKRHFEPHPAIEPPNNTGSLHIEIVFNVETGEAAHRTSSRIGGVSDFHLVAGPPGDPPPHLCDPLGPGDPPV